MDKKLDISNNKADKKPSKSKRETYDETLALIQEKGIRCVFGSKDGIDLLVKLHQMDLEYMLQKDYVKSGIVKKYLEDINNIFNK